jgi:hypothetical protein
VSIEILFSWDGAVLAMPVLAQISESGRLQKFTFWLKQISI